MRSSGLSAPLLRAGGEGTRWRAGWLERALLGALSARPGQQAAIHAMAMPVVRTATSCDVPCDMNRRLLDYYAPHNRALYAAEPQFKRFRFTCCDESNGKANQSGRGRKRLG